MSLIIINRTPVAEMKPMKVIHMDTKSEAKANLSRHPKDTHSREELDSLHRAIRFTHMFMHEESMAKMDEESPIEHKVKLPKLLKDL